MLSLLQVCFHVSIVLLLLFFVVFIYHKLMCPTFVICDGIFWPILNIIIEIHVWIKVLSLAINVGVVKQMETFLTKCYFLNYF